MPKLTLGFGWNPSLYEVVPVMVDEKTGNYYSDFFGNINEYSYNDLKNCPEQFHVDPSLDINLTLMDNPLIREVYVLQRTCNLIPKKNWPFCYLYYYKLSEIYKNIIGLGTFIKIFTTPDNGLRNEIIQDLYSNMGFKEEDIERAKESIACDLPTMLYACAKENRRLFSIGYRPANQKCLKDAYGRVFMDLDDTTTAGDIKLYVADEAKKTKLIPLVPIDVKFGSFMYGHYSQERNLSYNEFMAAYRGETDIDSNQCKDALIQLSFTEDIIARALEKCCASTPIMIQHLYKGLELQSDIKPHYMRPYQNGGEQK